MRSPTSSVDSIDPDGTEYSRTKKVCTRASTTNAATRFTNGFRASRRTNDGLLEVPAGESERAVTALTLIEGVARTPVGFLASVEKGESQGEKLVVQLIELVAV